MDCQSIKVPPRPQTSLNRPDLAATAMIAELEKTFQIAVATPQKSSNETAVSGHLFEGAFWA
jgi:hypothetical protein